MPNVAEDANFAKRPARERWSGRRVADFLHGNPLVVLVILRLTDDAERAAADASKRLVVRSLGSKLEIMSQLAFCEIVEYFCEPWRTRGHIRLPLGGRLLKRRLHTAACRLESRRRAAKASRNAIARLSAEKVDCASGRIELLASSCSGAPPKPTETADCRTRAKEFTRPTIHAANADKTPDRQSARSIDQLRGSRAL